MPPGYRLELVASEPLVQDPIVMDWDLRQAVGRRDARVRANLQAPEPFSSRLERSLSSRTRTGTA